MASDRLDDLSRCGGPGLGRVAVQTGQRKWEWAPVGPAREGRTIMEGKFERIIVTADVRRKWNI